MALIKCWECGKQISDTAAACPSCGAAKKVDEAERFAKSVAQTLMNAGTIPCPACGGRMTKMGAGERGSAFGSGNLLGAFTKQYRCACGHLA